MTCKFFLAGLLLISGLAQASSPVIVSTGWDLFPAAADARWTALGGSAIGLTFASGTQLSNPAQTQQSGEFSFYHQSRFAGILQEDAATFHIPALHNQSVSIVREGVDKIPDSRTMLLDWGADGQPGTNDTGEGNGQLDTGERLDRTKLSFFSQSRLGIYFPRQVKIGSLDLGYAVKGMYQSMGDYSGMGFGVDIGWNQPLFNHWTVGGVISNALTSIQIWDSGRTELTLPTVGLGLAGDVPLPFKSLSLLVLMNSEIRPSIASLSDDFQVGGSGGNWSAGIEAGYKKHLFVRLGRNQVQSVTGGIGLNWSHYTLNYAIQLAPQGSDLGQTHMLSFDLETQWAVEKLKAVY